MKILFMGTPEFARISLEQLADSEHEIVGVVSQPDKPVGRKQILTPPPVKSFAMQKEYEIFQPKSLKNGELTEVLNDLEPDIIIVVAYGKILPQYVLDYPKFGCINLHASILPKYRGAAPIQWSIINGEKETGVSTMLMDIGIDTGDVLLEEKVEIENNDTAQTLHDKLAVVGAELLLETINNIDKIERKPQNHSEMTYAPILTKETGKIDWSKSAQEVYNLIRGLKPWPSAWSIFEGVKFKVHEARVADSKGKIGEILSADSKNGLVIACGIGALVVENLQFEGGKAMDAKTYFAGHKIEVGTILNG